MSMRTIEALLAEATGLDVSTIGSATVERAIRRRMAEAGGLSSEEYFARLGADPVERQALIDDVTVPETWFFRDHKPFLLFAGFVRRFAHGASIFPAERVKDEGGGGKDLNNTWGGFPPRAIHAGAPLRVLSAPCATGEEPYSIAMMLHEMGLGGGKARVDAVDISAGAIEKALRARYRENSFRGDEGHFRARYFDKTAEGYLLHETIRKEVRFERGNLLDDDYLAGESLYDVIFCRNVLIYFSRETQRKAVKKLHRLLSDGGLLIVGHAEGMSVTDHCFSTVKYAGTFGYRKIPAREKPASGKRGTGGGWRPAEDQFEFRSSRYEPATATKGESGASPLWKPHGLAPAASGGGLMKRASATAMSSSVSLPHRSPPAARHPPAHIGQARRLADAGRFEEAAEHCLEHLRHDPVCVEAHYLLGLIRQSQGREEPATELFRKVLYLDPRHYETLVHLAVQAEARGDARTARVYRVRAARAAAERESAAGAARRNDGHG